MDAQVYFFNYCNQMDLNQSSMAACAARKGFSKSVRLAMLGKLIANTFQEALILLRLFLDRSLGRSKTLMIFSKFKLIGKLRRNPLNFLVKNPICKHFCSDCCSNHIMIISKLPRLVQLKANQV